MRNRLRSNWKFIVLVVGLMVANVGLYTQHAQAMQAPPLYSSCSPDDGDSDDCSGECEGGERTDCFACSGMCWVCGDSC